MSHRYTVGQPKVLGIQSFTCQKIRAIYHSRQMQIERVIFDGETRQLLVTIASMSAQFLSTLKFCSPVGMRE